MRIGEFIAFAVGFGVAAMLLTASRRKSRLPEDQYVRVAGRREMVDPPPDWDVVDEAADESFPASDPPGNY
ncbi:hypothetical protein [Paracoccus jeotgali]|uniref:hypothetical protein n=1 Tax=Paracoccus jeotgali TaxID=2065379 RepID=UPI0028AE2CC1|nr:hypothetical protein [Paracoccus jeotgali]